MGFWSWVSLIDFMIAGQLNIWIATGAVKRFRFPLVGGRVFVNKAIASLMRASAILRRGFFQRAFYGGHLRSAFTVGTFQGLFIRGFLYGAFYTGLSTAEFFWPYAPGLVAAFLWQSFLRSAYARFQSKRNHFAGATMRAAGSAYPEGVFGREHRRSRADRILLRFAELL